MTDLDPVGAAVQRSLRTGGQTLTQSRATAVGPSVTDPDYYAERVRMLRVMAPQFEREPEVLAQLAASPVDAETLARQAAAYTGLYTSDQLARQIASMGPATQRVMWAQLTPPQQASLSSMGYTPPVRTRQKRNPVLGAIGSVGGSMFEGFHKALGFAIDPALELVKDLGDIPPEIYRTIRQLPPEMQWIAVGTAAVGAAALTIAAPPLAAFIPGLAATGMASGMATASTVGFGALGGAAAGGFVAATVLTPGDNEFIDAWHLANSGEALYTTEARTVARRLLGEDPNLETLAATLGYDAPYDVAAAFAGVQNADQAKIMAGQIAEIAERAGPQGTPEFQAAYGLLETLTQQAQMKAAIRVLQFGKISFGRDVARVLQLTPNTNAYNIVSGGFDAAFMIGLDPTIAATKFLRVGRALRYGVFPDASTARLADDVAPYAQRILDVTTADNWAGRRTRNAFEVIAQGMNSNRWEQTMHHLLPSAKRLRGGLGTWGANPDNKVGALWTVDDVRRYFESAIGQGDMLAGRGASWQKGAIEIPHVGRYTLKLREAKLWGARQINFADELNISRRQLTIVDRLGETTKLKAARATVAPGRLRPQDYAPGAVLPTYAEAPAANLTFGGKAVPEDVSNLRFGGGRLGTLEDVEAGPMLTVVASVPVIGTAVRQFATIAKTLAERIPVRPYVAVAGSGPRGAAFVEDMRAFTELFRVIGVPGAVRRAWFNTIVDAPSLAARQLAVRAATKTMLDAAGIGASRQGEDLMNIFVQKLDQRFLEVTTDIELMPGFTTKTSVFPGAGDAVFLAVPTFRDLRQAIGQSTVLDTLLNAGNNHAVESMMARIWKPSVLLRLGFIPRAAGDELLAFLAVNGLHAYARTFVVRAASQPDDELLVHAKILQDNFVNPVNSLLAGVSHGRTDGLDDFAAAVLLRYSQWVRGALRQGWQPEGELMGRIRDKVLGPHTLRRALFGGVSSDEMRYIHDLVEENGSAFIPELAAGQTGTVASGSRDIHRVAQVDGRNQPLGEISLTTKADVFTDHTQSSPRFREGVVYRTHQAVDHAGWEPGSPMFDYRLHDPGPTVLQNLGSDAGGILDHLAAVGRDTNVMWRRVIGEAGHDNLNNVTDIIDDLEDDHWFRQELIDNDLVPKSTDTARTWLTRVAGRQGTEGELARTIVHHFDSAPTARYLTVVGASAPDHWKGYRLPLDDDYSAGLHRAGVEQASDPVYADAFTANMGAVVGAGALPVIDPPLEGTTRFWVPVLDGDTIAILQGHMARTMDMMNDADIPDYLQRLLQESSERFGDVVTNSGSYRVAAQVMADIAGLPPRTLTAYGMERAGERAIPITTSAMSSLTTVQDVARILNRYGLTTDFDPDAALAAYTDVARGAGFKTAGPFDDTIGNGVIDYGDGVWGRRISPSHEAVPIPEAHIERVDADGNPVITIDTVIQARIAKLVEEEKARTMRGYWPRRAAEGEAMGDEWTMQGGPDGKGGFESTFEWDDSPTGLPREEWGSDHFADDVFDDQGRLRSTQIGDMRIVKGPIVGDLPIGIASDGTITVDMDYVKHDLQTGDYLSGRGVVRDPGDTGDAGGIPAGAAPGLPPLYHGTQTPITEGMRDVGGTGAENLFGPGFYTTSSPRIAEEYTAKAGLGPQPKPSVYQVHWKGEGTPKILDVDQPFPPEMDDAFYDAVTGEVLGQAGWSHAQYEEIRDYLSDPDAPHAEWIDELVLGPPTFGLATPHELFDFLTYLEATTEVTAGAKIDALLDLTRRAGFRIEDSNALMNRIRQAVYPDVDAFTHQGGLRIVISTPTDHQVYVWLKPQDLQVTRRGQDLEGALEPDLAPGHVRVYRRQRPGSKPPTPDELHARRMANLDEYYENPAGHDAEEVEGRWFTTNRESASRYPLEEGRTAYDGELVYVDLTQDEYARMYQMADQNSQVQYLAAMRDEDVVLPRAFEDRIKIMPGRPDPVPDGRMDTLSVQARKALDDFGISPDDVLDYAATAPQYATMLANYVHLALVTGNTKTAMGLTLSGMGYPMPSKAGRYLERMGTGPLRPRDELMWETVGPAVHDRMKQYNKTPVLRRETKRYGVFNRNDVTETKVMHTLNERHANQLAPEDLPPVVHLPEEQFKKLTGWDRIVEKGFRTVIGPAIDVIVRKPVAVHHYMEARATAEAHFSSWLPTHLFGDLYRQKTRVHRLNSTRSPDPAEAAYIRSQLTDIQQGMGPEAVWAREHLTTSALFGGDGMPSAYAEGHWDEIMRTTILSDDPAARDLKHLLDRFTDDPVDYVQAPDGSYRRVVNRIRSDAENPFVPTREQERLVRTVAGESGFPIGTMDDFLAAYFDDIRGNAQILDQTARRLGRTDEWAPVASLLPTPANWSRVSDERTMAQQLANEWRHWRKHEHRYQQLLEMSTMDSFADDMALELMELGAERPFWVSKLSDPEIAVVDEATTSYEKMWRHSHNVAQERAIGDTIPFIDSDGIRSQFQEYVRNFMPFLFAEDQFLRRWGRVARIAPDTLRKGQLLMNGLRSTGIVQKDQFGNEVFVYPGSATFTAALGRIPFIPTMLPVASMMTGQVKYMLPGLDNYGMPSGSPLLTIPMGFITQSFPELQPIHDRFTGDRGQRAGIIRSLVPTSMMRFYDAVLGDEDSNRKLASAMMSAMQVAEANGWAPEPDASATEVEKYMDRVRATARVMLFAQAMAGFVVPSSPGLALAGDPDMPGASGSSWSFAALTGLNFTPAALNTEFIELVHNMGIEDGTLRFIERYPDVTPDDLFNSNLAYSTRLTDVPSGAPIPTHRTAWEFYEDNLDYFAEFEYAGAYLLPPGRTPEEVADRPDSVHADQLAAGLRIRNSPDELYGDLKWASAAPVYFDGLAQYQSQSERPLSPDERAEVNAIWDAWKNDFFTAHPLFSERLQSGEGRIRRQQTIRELRVVLRDPGRPQPWHAPAMAEMLGAWDIWQNTSKELGDSRTARNIRRKDELDREWTAWVDNYVRTHPETGTLWGAVLRPESAGYGSGVGEDRGVR